MQAKIKKNAKPIDPLVKQLADRIKQLRKDAGFTSYEDFAKDRNLPKSQYGRYEKGQNMRYTSLLKIAKVHGMTLSKFFSEGFE